MTRSRASCAAATNRRSTWFRWFPPAATRRNGGWRWGWAAGGSDAVEGERLLSAGNPAPLRASACSALVIKLADRTGAAIDAHAEPAAAAHVPPVGRNLDGVPFPAVVGGGDDHQ